VPRINRVAKARKSPGTCGGCGKEIPVGAPYKWIKFRFGGKRFRCGDCDFKGSDLTQSAFLGQTSDLNDRISELANLEEPSEIRDEIEDIVSEFNNLADECESNRENMPEQLQDSDTGSMLEERASTCRDVADNLEGVDCDFDEEAARSEAKTEFEEETTEAERSEMDQEDIDAAIEEKFDEKKRARCEEICDEAQGFTYDGP
jgi:chemotaxis protein histidine kinase CheA